VRRYSDGKVLSRTDDFNGDMRRKYGAPFWDLHRVDVQRALAERAKELGAKVRLGARVADLDFDKPSVKLESGEELQADLIVAADGLWSKSRERFLAVKSESDEPLPTGDLAYRIVLKLDEVDDPELRDWISKPSCQFWIGPGAHVVAYSLRDGHMFNIVLLVPDNLPAGVARQAGSIDEMRAIFDKWDPVLNRFLDQVKSVDKWKLMHRPELDSWISDKSNFVFIGDSCHPMVSSLLAFQSTFAVASTFKGILMLPPSLETLLPSCIVDLPVVSRLETLTRSHSCRTWPKAQTPAWKTALSLEHYLVPCNPSPNCREHWSCIKSYERSAAKPSSERLLRNDTTFTCKMDQNSGGETSSCCRSLARIYRASFRAGGSVLRCSPGSTGTMRLQRQKPP
jgi:hypothetical protein